MSSNFINNIPAREIQTATGKIQFRNGYVVVFPNMIAFQRLQEFHRRSLGEKPEQLQK